MLGDSWPRGTHQIREMPLADRNSKERATRILDAEVGAQFQQRQSDPLMKTEAQEAGASQK
jgi:hypothetical protein